MECSFIISGNPQGKGRPRMTRSGHVYTPQATKDYEQHIKAAYQKGCHKLSGAIAAEVIIKQAIPSSWSIKKRQAALQGQILPTVKPDCDNVLKCLMDGLNGIAYDDDKQVVSANIRKVYDLEPSVFIRLWELEEDNIKIGGTD